jgi:hypothetical protein
MPDPPAHRAALSSILALALFTNPHLSTAREATQPQAAFVALAVQADGAQPATIIAQTGELATYENDAVLAESVGLVPMVKNNDPASLTVVVSSVSYDENRQPHVQRRIDTVTGTSGIVRFEQSRLTIRVFGVATSIGALHDLCSQLGTPIVAIGSSAAHCAVSCSGTRAEALSVLMNCGSCSGAVARF